MQRLKTVNQKENKKEAQIENRKPEGKQIMLIEGTT